MSRVAEVMAIRRRLRLHYRRYCQKVLRRAFGFRAVMPLDEFTERIQRIEHKRQFCPYPEIQVASDLDFHWNRETHMQWLKRIWEDELILLATKHLSTEDFADFIGLD